MDISYPDPDLRTRLLARDRRAQPTISSSTKPGNRPLEEEEIRHLSQSRVPATTSLGQRRHARRIYIYPILLALMNLLSSHRRIPILARLAEQDRAADVLNFAAHPKQSATP